MALPLIGIKTELVAQTIGLGSNVVRELCAGKLTAEAVSASRINKWSKYKPVRYNNVAPNRGVGADWWKSENGNCGLNVPNYTTMSALFTALRSGAIMWDYLPPLGTTGQPCRLADFRAYEHTAQPPMIPLNLADIYYASLGTMGCALDLRVPSEYELTINDIGYTWNLGEMYFGVAISRQGTTTYKYMTESTTISSGSGGGIDVPLDGELGMYDVVYFLAETAKTSFTSPDIANTFIPIPDAWQVVQVKESAVTVSILAVWDAGKTSYELYVGSETGSLTLNNCFLNIKYGDNPMPSGSQSGEVTISLGTIVANTVPESGPVKTGNVVSLPDYDTRQGGLVYFTNSSNAAYNVSDMIGTIE